AAVDTKAASAGVSTYDALRALNKGVEQRAARQKKLEVESAPAFLEQDDQRVGRLARGLGARRDQAEERELQPSADLDKPSNEVARLEILPMVGRVLDAHHLLLYRTVIRDAQTYRQGLLLDVDALGTWLRERAIGGDALAEYAATAFATSLAPLRLIGGDGGDVYQHRFADP